MRARIVLLAVLALAWCGAAHAGSMCAGSQGISQTSVQLKAAGDIVSGRRFLSIQNIGPVVLCCGVGTANAVLATCTNGVMLAPTAMFVPQALGEVTLPDGDVSCIAPAGTGSAVACDF